MSITESDPAGDVEAIRAMVQKRKRTTANADTKSKKKTKKKPEKAIGPFEEIPVRGIGSGFGSALQTILSIEVNDDQVLFRLSCFPLLR